MWICRQNKSDTIQLCYMTPLFLINEVSDVTPTYIMHAFMHDENTETCLFVSLYTAVFKFLIICVVCVCLVPISQTHCFSTVLAELPQQLRTNGFSLPAHCCTNAVQELTSAVDIITTIMRRHKLLFNRSAFLCHGYLQIFGLWTAWTKAICKHHLGLQEAVMKFYCFLIFLFFL